MNQQKALANARSKAGITLEERERRRKRRQDINTLANWISIAKNPEMNVRELKYEIENDITYLPSGIRDYLRKAWARASHGQRSEVVRLIELAKQVLTDTQTKAVKLNNEKYRREIDDAIRQARKGDVTELKTRLTTMYGFAPSEIRGDLRTAAQAAGNGDAQGCIRALQTARGKLQ